MSRIAYAGDIYCNQSMALWNSTAWVPPPYIDGFDPLWTYGYGVACGDYNSNLVLAFNYNNTIRLAIIDHESYSVSIYDPPPHISIQTSYSPDMYISGSQVYLVSSSLSTLFSFDISTNAWASVINGMTVVFYY